MAVEGSDYHENFQHPRVSVGVEISMVIRAFLRSCPVPPPAIYHPGIPGGAPFILALREHTFTSGQGIQCTKDTYPHKCQLSGEQPSHCAQSLHWELQD